MCDVGPWQVVLHYIGAIAGPLKSTPMLGGSIFVFLSAFGWSRTCSRHEELLSRIQRSGFGQRNLGAPLQCFASIP